MRFLSVDIKYLPSYGEGIVQTTNIPPFCGMVVKTIVVGKILLPARVVRVRFPFQAQNIWGRQVLTGISLKCKTCSERIHSLKSSIQKIKDNSNVSPMTFEMAMSFVGADMKVAA